MTSAAASLVLTGGRLHAPPVAAAANDGVLPTDVLHEVLLRLPADALCRLRLVCRSWRSLTSDRPFAAAHSSRHPLLVGLHNLPHEVHAMNLSGKIVKRVRLAVPAGFGLSTHHDLACISGWSSKTSGQARVLNLATGAATVLLPPGGGAVTSRGRRSAIFPLQSAYIIGHVPSANEYKALHIRKNRCHVMTLGEDDSGWRERPYAPVMVALWLSHWAVVDGVAYFLANHQVPVRIASFDMASEDWKPTVLPGPVSSLLCSTGKKLLPQEHWKYIQLAELSGCLVLVHRNIEDFSRTDLWFLEDRDKALWTKRYSMLSTPGQIYPLVASSDGRIAAWVDELLVLVYDPKTATWDTLGTVGDYSVVRMHHGSLLCPGL